jgi:hypothetical protein
MIEKLNKRQEAQIAEYHERYFSQATSTERADRGRAERAAQRMAEIASIKAPQIRWVNNPQDGHSLWYFRWDSIRDSLRHSLWESLRHSIRHSLWSSLRHSLRHSLRSSLWDYPRSSLRHSLRSSLWDSLGDTGLLAYYTFAVDVLGIEIDNLTREKLYLHNEIAASCFALWIVPGTVILCERPTSVTVDNGKLIDISWEKEKK